MVAVVAAAHHRGKLAVAHINTLDGAREAIEAGVDGLMHLFRGAVGDPALVQLAKEHHTFIVPTWSAAVQTCGTNSGAAIAAEPRFQADLPPSALKDLAAIRQRATFLSCEGARQITPLLRDAGVPLIAGTDADNRGITHGASLHGEPISSCGNGVDPGRGAPGCNVSARNRFRVAGSRPHRIRSASRSAACRGQS